MLRDIDTWFESQPEPAKGCLLALRAHLLQLDPHITEAWKYRMPFYCYNGKMCCYLWIHKQLQQPYIGIVEGKNIIHPLLQIEKRARMKILLIDPREDIPMDTVNDILGKMVKWYAAKKR
ncbi:DUF1801 domain-containing protein [Chitinophaga sp. 22321]|uniref:DUF1801 domain-containing protein n=1 Tax=Chitinophaga hostae TaxID=2831022 RepID=A0ABS5J6V1_9BACT|nr:DUF1801 domain-containing protein [Chitinophaga hostae]MBS0030900.1 DUF1801 domain-containing protein [Chitinophaga hostae]